MSDLRPIGFHHVGGRSGGSDTPWVTPRFAGDVATVMYEADEDAVAQMKAQGVTALPYCLADRNGEGFLNLTYCLYGSSLYPLDPQAAALTMNVRGLDYRLSVTNRTVERRPVKLRRLDDLPEIRTGEIPPPDVLSMDTQGSELDILRGGEQTIERHTVAIVSEVEFVALYEGQPLFGDICKYLDERGFAFMQILFDGASHPYRQPLGLRGRGITTFGEALFLRKLSHVTDAAQVPILAFLAHLFGQHDLGFEALEMIGDERLEELAASGREYLRFLRDLRRAAASMPHVLPKQFQDFFSFEDSRNRFDDARRIDVERSLMEKQDRIASEVRQTEIAALAVLQMEEDSTVEGTLRLYGLDALADEMKKRRLEHVKQYLDVLGLEITVTRR
ncbi:MAG: FkbM family methyltransferase [Candidatus Eremiobacteraeota bacterium]|nr:FkbM family methyltransferase [Candidatus Eremiobacteraeota bacterium]